MTPREARKRIKSIRRHYLDCSVCLIPKVFCRHSEDERRHALKALQDLARRRKRKPKPKRTKPHAHEQNNPPATK